MIRQERKIYLSVTYDDGKPPKSVDVDEVLNWRTWKQSEADRIAKVATGNLRRFSTRDQDGKFCDLELSAE